MFFTENKKNIFIVPIPDQGYNNKGGKIPYDDIWVFAAAFVNIPWT